MAARHWRLAPDSAARVREFAGRFRPCRLRRIVTSPEPKAVETAQLLAGVLDLPTETRDGLEEHHRLVEQQTPDRTAFLANVNRFFAQPDAVVFGTESAAAAHQRFRSAVEAVMDETDDDELIVSHGTVMSLLIAAGGNGAPLDIWSSLTLPDHIALDWPSLMRASVAPDQATR